MGVYYRLPENAEKADQVFVHEMTSLSKRLMQY